MKADTPGQLGRTGARPMKRITIIVDERKLSLSSNLIAEIVNMSEEFRVETYGPKLRKPRKDKGTRRTKPEGEPK